MSIGEKLLALASWEPIWSVYLPGTGGYWRGFGDQSLPIFNLQFMNPIYFVGTAALVGIGAWKRWLTCYEILMSVPLLAIPYVTRAYDNAMLSHARFAAVVFPAYIVAGHLLAKLPREVAMVHVGAERIPDGSVCRGIRRGQDVFLRAIGVGTRDEGGLRSL